MSYKKQKESLKRRQKENVKNKGRSQRTNKGILDFSEYEEVNFYKPSTDSNNVIDIIPWTVKSNNHPQLLKPGDLDYILDVWIHFKVGPAENNYICLKRTFGKACPICQEREQMKEDEDIDEKTLDRMKPTHRAIYNIIDLNDESKGVQLFEASHAYFEQEMEEEIQAQFDQKGEEAPTITDLEEGRTIEFRATSNKFEGHTYLKYKSFKFSERDPYGENILDEAYPLDSLLVIPTYEEVKNAMLGIDQEDSGEEDGPPFDAEEKEETKKEKIKRNRKPRDTNREKKEVEKTEPTDEWRDLIKSLEGKNKREIRKFIIKHQLDVTISAKMTEEEMIEEIVKKVSSTGKGTKKDDRCPHGHIFGKDCDSSDDCADDCPEYFDCIDEQERLEEEE